MSQTTLHLDVGDAAARVARMARRHGFAARKRGGIVEITVNATPAEIERGFRNLIRERPELGVRLESCYGKH